MSRTELAGPGRDVVRYAKEKIAAGIIVASIVTSGLAGCRVEVAHAEDTDAKENQGETEVIDELEVIDIPDEIVDVNVVQTAVPTPMQTPMPAVRARQEFARPAPFYDAQAVSDAYVMTSREYPSLVEVRVDPRIMEVVRNLRIKAEGDMTEKIIRAIPVDDARSHFADSIGVRYSAEYQPFDIRSIAEFGLRALAGHTGVEMNSRAATSLAELVLIARESGVGIYVAYGYRSNEQQAAIYAANPGGAGNVGGSEHLSGYAVDLYADPYARYGLTAEFAALANRYGWVNSMGRSYDPAHYLDLDGVTVIGMTQALMDAGFDVNSRYVVAQARTAVFQIYAAQARGR